MKTIVPWLALCVGLAAIAPAAHAAPTRGEMVFEADFEGADALKAWTKDGEGTATLVKERDGSQAVLIERPKEKGPGACILRIALPLEKLRGTRVSVEAVAKADDVAAPPQPWNGIKCMLHTVAPGGKRWEQQNALHGTFDWKPIGFQAIVPADASEAWLVLGLEETTGKVALDDIRIKIVAVKRKPLAKPAAKLYKGHDLPRLRGAMIGNNVTEADLQVFGGDWKANHVRWQLTWDGFPQSPADKADVPTYEAWLEGKLKHLDAMLPVCQRLGIKVLVDLHTPPGGRTAASECRMFQEKEFQEAFLKTWDKIARRYVGNKTVWGYDLVNEPVEGRIGEGLMNWQDLAEATARRVRKIDAMHAIILEPAPWGGPEAIEWFEPIDTPGVVYSVHMYLPHQFTHQGVYDNPKGISYPGEINGRRVGKAELEAYLKPAIDFQRDYGVHMYIGEFSAIRWAPGDSAYNYLRDVIDIFEAHNWDWAYHAFREWDGWSVEHGADPNDHARSKTPTNRQKLLMGWFEKNKR